MDNFEQEDHAMNQSEMDNAVIYNNSTKFLSLSRSGIGIANNYCHNQYRCSASSNELSEDTKRVSQTILNQLDSEFDNNLLPK